MFYIDDDFRVAFTHQRDRHNQYKTIATLEAFDTETEEWVELAYTVALCSLADNFSRVVGRKISLARLMPKIETFLVGSSENGLRNISFRKAIWQAYSLDHKMVPGKTQPVIE